MRLLSAALALALWMRPLLPAPAACQEAGTTEAGTPPRKKRPRPAHKPGQAHETGAFGRPEALPLASQMPKELPQDTGDQPWYIRALLVPLPKGMFIRLPVVDTDPNRGVTYGVMPIWVFNGDGRIKHIHAPSLTYNKTFKLSPTYRYYYYPTKDSTLVLRGSYGQVSDRELLGDFQDFNFLGRDWVAALKLHYNVDGSGRFFGLGPATQQSAEANYLRDSLEYSAAFGAPLPGASDWNAIFSHRLAGEKISNGPVDSLPDIDATFPGAAPAHRHQDASFRLALNYDTRDSPITTTRGGFADFFVETSQRSLASEYVFQRYGTDLRYFYRRAPQDRFVTAGRVLFEQLVGEAPFWLLPQLGGKYIHRAYGEGRFIDHGILVSSLEERVKVYQVKTAGVETEFELAPFAGIGIPFRDPAAMARKYFRPVVGAAVRAVARPQVVGSIDFGVGQEGLTTFMDINYAF